MIKYELKTNSNYSYKIDKTKRNILLIGKGETSAKNKIILNPLTVDSAKKIYGENSNLYKAYEQAYNITKDSNIFTVNCPLYTDCIEIIDTIVQYDFDFVVPVDILLRDTFYNPLTSKIEYFAGYYLNQLGVTQNRTVLIFSDNSSLMYNDIDDFIIDMNKVQNVFQQSNSEILNNYGNNIVFVWNNFNDEFLYSNVILAASLSSTDYKTYPTNISYTTNFDIDYEDMSINKTACFYKYHPSTNDCSIEQLRNFRFTEDIYKNVLIDLLVKHVTRLLDLSEFEGVLFNPYVKIKIEKTVTKILDGLLNDAVVSYKINQIGFYKTGLGVGSIYIDVSITPYSLVETINIMMEL